MPWLKTLYAAMKPGAVGRHHRPCRHARRRHPRDGREAAPHRPGGRSRPISSAPASCSSASATCCAIRPTTIACWCSTPRSAARPTASSSSSGSRVERSAPKPPPREPMPAVARAYWVLLALIARARPRGAGRRGSATACASRRCRRRGMVGGLWLNALKMTVIPLIVALLVTGIAQGAEAARGRADRRAVGAVVRHRLHRARRSSARLMIQLLTSLFPLPQRGRRGAAGRARRRSTRRRPRRRCRASPISSAASCPTMSIAAASNGEVLPLVVFALLFALALTRIDAASAGARWSACSRPSPTPCWWSSAGCCGSRRSACSRWPSRSAPSAGGAAFAGVAPLYRAGLGRSACW